MMKATQKQERKVQLAASALANAGLVHAYGHVSTRIDPLHFLVCASGPLANVGTRKGTVCRVGADLPHGVLGEVRIHREIYATRPEINAVCRIMPPVLMALSTQGILPKPRHGIGAYFDTLELWDDPTLLRNDAAAARLAERMGDSPAIVMRGNGAVIAAETAERAVTLAWFLEDAARVEYAVRSMGSDPDRGQLNSNEIESRKLWSGGVAERMWEYLTSQPIP